MRGEDQVAGAVVPRARERAEDAAVGETGEPFLRERRAQEVAAEPLEAGAVVGTDGAIGVEIEALEVRVARADGPHPRAHRVPARPAAPACRRGRRRRTGRGRRRR